MIAQELRIGNWYQTKWVTEPKTTYQKVVKIVEGGDWSMCEPIPLTEEILLKAGFEDNGYGNIISYYNVFEIMYRTDTKKVILEGTILHIEFVHQLQNLYYALTGTELEITL